MMSPYTAQATDAIMIAQSSVGLALGGLLWTRRMNPRLSTIIFSMAIASAVLAWASGEFLAGVGVTLPPEHTKTMLKIAAGAATVAMLLTRRVPLVVVALLGQAALWRLTDYIQESDGELVGVHLLFLGLLVGLHWRTSPLDDPPASRSPAEAPALAWRPWKDDVLAFAIATTLGALVCRLLLDARTDSADEWGYTFQAALFAKLHAYGSVPPCVSAFENYWVFEHLGRRFAQYTPGWPLFMTPFVALRAAWLAGPVSFGLLAAGLSRLGRRAAAGYSPGTAPPSQAEVRLAGRLTVGVLCLSSTVLINAGSRFPHLFVCGLFAWAIEALLTLATPALDAPGPGGQWLWGAVLGSSTSLILSARPGDGATLGVGLFLFFLYAAVRRRITWRALAGAAVPFVFFSGLTLVILRLQMGTWFTPGYSLAAGIRPWAKPAFSVPKPNEFKWGLPIATGSYCWWPLSPAIGLAGIVSLRGKAQRLGFIFFFSLVPLVTLLTLLEFGRGWDFGYGPRYSLPFILPMSIGTGTLLSRLWTDARAPASDRTALQVGAPAGVVILAIFVGTVRLAPLVYPFTYADVHAHSRLQAALATASLPRSIVLGGPGVSSTDPLDLTENLPLDLYPDQPVLITLDGLPDTVRCLREHYPDRALYRAVPSDPTRIVPFK
jgi:hypothetical protein